MLKVSYFDPIIPAVHRPSSGKKCFNNAHWDSAGSEFVQHHDDEPTLFWPLCVVETERLSLNLFHFNYISNV